MVKLTCGQYKQCDIKHVWPLGFMRESTYFDIINKSSGSTIKPFGIKRIIQILISTCMIPSPITTKLILNWKSLLFVYQEARRVEASFPRCMGWCNESISIN